MHGFKLGGRLVGDDWHYARSLLTVKNVRIHAYLEREFEESLLWPGSAVQLQSGDDYALVRLRKEVA